MSPRSTATPNPSAPRSTATVSFVGAGPGDGSLLTLAAVEALKAAEVVIVDQLAREDIVEQWCQPGTEVLDAGFDENGTALTHASRAKLIVRTAKSVKNGSVVRLMDGDPATFGGLTEEAVACQKAGISFEVIPGVSAVTAVPSYAGIPLTSKTSTAVHVVSGNRRLDPALAADDTVTVVVLGPPDVLATTLSALAEAGRDPKTPVAVTEHGTTVRQRTVIMTLAEAAKQLPPVECPALAVIGDTVDMHRTLSWFETKPLFGWRILVPRTKAQSASMTRRLAAYGGVAEVVPTISVEPPRTPQQMERAVKGLVTGRYEWVGFTSVNAVRAIREKFEEFGLDARAFAGLKIAAVGGVTAAALEAWGLRPDLVPSGERSARGLLEEWPPYDEVLDPINRVFLPRADIATETLSAGLQEMGWEVDDVTAYRTVRAAPPPAPIREAIKGGAFDAVAFTSSSTVRNLVGIAGKPHPSTVIACIGPQTAKTAEEHGLRVDVMAPEASSAALIDALADYGRALAVEAAESGTELTRPSERRMRSRRRAR